MKKKKIVVLLPSDLKAQLDRKRKKEGFSIVWYVTKVLREALKRRAA